MCLSVIPQTLSIKNPASLELASKTLLSCSSEIILPFPELRSKANANENKRKTSRSLAASSRKLGESYKRSKCVKHCKRLSDRVCEKATSFPVSSQSEVFSGRDETADRRGKEAHSKRSHTTGARQARPVSRSPVPPRRERRVIQTDLQPQKTERACEIPTFQDGRVVPSERSVTARRLDDQIGSQGCIFLRGNGRQGEKISTLPVAGADVQVPVSPIRAGLSPMRLHQAPETCSGISTENRDQNDLLLGRHAPSQSEHARIASGRQDYLGSSGSSGICDQHRKVNTSAQPSDGIPGHDNRLQGHDIEIISRKNTEDTDEVWSDASAGGGISQGTVKTDRDRIGTFSSTTQAILPVRLHYRQLQMLRTTALIKVNSYESIIKLTAECKEEIRWWMTHLEEVNGRAVTVSPPDITMHH